MTEYEVVLRVPVKITVAEDSDAISRFIGMEPEAAKEIGWTPGATEQDVLFQLALYAAYGQQDASLCDGWADKPRDEVTMRLDYGGIEVADY